MWSPGLADFPQTTSSTSLVTNPRLSDTELLSAPFLSYQVPEKPAVQAIVCTPPNTMSAIREPFRYALYEGGETN